MLFIIYNYLNRLNLIIRKKIFQSKLRLYKIINVMLMLFSVKLVHIEIKNYKFYLLFNTFFYSHNKIKKKIKKK